MSGILESPKSEFAPNANPPIGTESEEWRPIVGFEGRYEVSNLGRVRSLDRAIPRISTLGKQYNRFAKGQILVLYPTKDGYLACRLGRKTMGYVHILVAQMFLGDRRKKIIVRHLNGVCTDNNVNNLAYGTRRDNIQDAKRHGTWQQGGLKRRKLSLEQRNLIRSLHSTDKYSLKDLAKMFKVGTTTILNVTEDYLCDLR